MINSEGKTVKNAITPKPSLIYVMKFFVVDIDVSEKKSVLDKMCYF